MNHMGEAEMLLKDAAMQAPQANTMEERVRILIMVIAANAHATCALAYKQGWQG